MSTPPSEQSPARNKPRKKRPADDVSFEELLAAHVTTREPGQLPPEGVVLIGVDRELQRRMADRSGWPLPEAPESGPNFGAPSQDAAALNAPNNEAGGQSPDTFPVKLRGNSPGHHITPLESDRQPLSLTSAPGIDAPNFSAPDFPAPDAGTLDFDLRGLLTQRNSPRTYTIRPVVRIEDVFTAAERDLLRWLWDQGRRVPMTDRIRLVIGPNGEGARRLAAQAGLIYNTFKNLTRSLAAKFALDIAKPEKNLPTVYAVYEHSAILERQRRRGFTRVVHKNGGGRELLDGDGRPAPRRLDLNVAELEDTLVHHTSGR